MKVGEIYLAAFPFSDKATEKLRPVLLLAGPIGPHSEVLVAYISSVVPAQQLASDLQLDPTQADGKSTQLKVLSVLRLHKLATIHARLMRRRLGQLSPPLRAEAEEKLRTLLEL